MKRKKIGKRKHWHTLNRPLIEETDMELLQYYLTDNAGDLLDLFGCPIALWNATRAAIARVGVEGKPTKEKVRDAIYERLMRDPVLH